MPQKVYGFQLISESDFDSKEIKDIIKDDIKNFYSLDLSFQTWLEKSNNLTKLDIDRLYDNTVASLKSVFKYKKYEKVLKDNIATLKKILKIKYKEIKEADKKFQTLKNSDKSSKLASKPLIY